MEPLPKLLFTTEEAAEIFRLHRNTVYAAIHQGKLKASRKGWKLLIHKDEIERFAKADVPELRNSPGPRPVKNAARKAAS